MVQHMKPFPSFDDLRSMLDLEEHSYVKNKIPPQDSALISQNLEKFEKLDSRGTTTTPHRGGRRQPRRGGRTNRSYQQPHGSRGSFQQQQVPFQSPRSFRSGPIPPGPNSNS